MTINANQSLTLTAHWALCDRLAARLELERPGEANFSATDFHQTFPDVEMIAMDANGISVGTVETI